jgi:hypothetical protein
MLASVSAFVLLSFLGRNPLTPDAFMVCLGWK